MGSKLKFLAPWLVCRLRSHHLLGEKDVCRIERGYHREKSSVEREEEFKERSSIRSRSHTQSSHGRRNKDKEERSRIAG